MQVPGTWTHAGGFFGLGLKVLLPAQVGSNDYIKKPFSRAEVEASARRRVRHGVGSRRSEQKESYMMGQSRSGPEPELDRDAIRLIIWSVSFIPEYKI